jgi:hypothetical protein
MRGPALLFSIFVTAGAGVPTPSPPSWPPARLSAADEETTRFAGTYVYVGGESERAVVKAAVDRATEGMFGKVIARQELMKRSEPRPSYTIRFEEGGRVSVESPGFPAESSLLDGTEVVVRNKYGDVLKQSQQFVEGVLVQSGRNDDGSGSTEFRLGSDGNTLQVMHVSRSPRLPRPVVYSLTYFRAPRPR